ncbi:MAG TPA: ribosome maturation factor RimM [Zeimonas sp.]|nr:ribosome maturation factor RimM [Zeimonas sp.]
MEAAGRGALADGGAPREGTGGQAAGRGLNGSAKDGPAAGSTDGPEELPADAVALGRVAGAWGVRGWLRVVPFNDPLDSILTVQPRWWLRGPHGCRMIEIEQARVHGGEIVAKAAGLDDRDRAQDLKGCEVLIGRSSFPRAQDGEVYWIDLIGCAVTNPGGDSLGVVVAVDEFGAHPVLRLEAQGESGRTAVRRLIPFVPEYVLEIDLAGRRIVADWGLDY